MAELPAIRSFDLPLDPNNQHSSFMALPNEIQVLGNMPSPMTDIEQQSAIAEIPRRSVDPAQNVIRKHPSGYEYVTIGYVEVGLNEIFGAGNWNSVSFPGYPQNMQSSDKKITILDRRLLIVRWASGFTQSFEGYGEGSYFLNNAMANIAASLEVAKTEAIKAAAKRIGPRFGMGLKDAIDSGAVDELTGEDQRDILMEAVGNRITDNGTILTVEKLNELANMIGGVTDANDLQGKALKNVVAVLRTMPTMDEKMDLIREAAKSGVKASIEMTPQQIKTATAEARKKAIEEMPL